MDLSATSTSREHWLLAELSSTVVTFVSAKRFSQQQIKQDMSTYSGTRDLAPNGRSTQPRIHTEVLDEDTKLHVKTRIVVDVPEEEVWRVLKESVWNIWCVQVSLVLLFETSWLIVPL